jgi:prophage tail gpP-like protein
MCVYSKMCLELNPSGNSVVSTTTPDDHTQRVTALINQSNLRVPVLTNQTGLRGIRVLIMETMFPHRTFTNALPIVPLLPANTHHSDSSDDSSDSDCDSLPELVETSSYNSES